MKKLVDSRVSTGQQECKTEQFVCKISEWRNRLPSSNLADRLVAEMRDMVYWLHGNSVLAEGTVLFWGPQTTSQDWFSVNYTSADWWIKAGKCRFLPAGRINIKNVLLPVAPTNGGAPLAKWIAPLVTRSWTRARIHMLWRESTQTATTANPPDPIGQRRYYMRAIGSRFKASVYIFLGNPLIFALTYVVLVDGYCENQRLISLALRIHVSASDRPNMQFTLANKIKITSPPHRG